MFNRLAFAPAISLRPSTTARFALYSAAPATTSVRPFRINAVAAQKQEPVAAETPEPVRRLPAIMGPVVPDPRLFDFNVEDRAQLRSDVLKGLSKYVKDHELQDADNKRVVKCDKKLGDLFGVSECSILQMSKYVSPYLMKPAEAGGRYVEEARNVEEAWMRENPEKGVVSRKRRTRRTSPADSANKADGRKIFKPVVLSDELAAVCLETEMPRQQIVKAIWKYIRMNNLKGEPGEPVQCDFLLKKVYGTDTIDVKGIMKGIGKHVTKKE